MSRTKNNFIFYIIPLIFFISGSSALIYQTAWQRLLTVHYGVGAVSVALIVSIYMFGLGLGGYFGGILAERIKRKILFYLIIEIVIGAFGIISPFILDMLGQHTSGIEYGYASILIFAFLAIPTFLMGITLPLLVKIFNSVRKDFFKTLSFLYFINTIGAAFGAVFSTYFLISFFGLDSSIYVAAVLNFLIGILVFVFGQDYLSDTAKTDSAQTVQVRGGGNLNPTWAYGIVFVTGFIAIGYELLWFRVSSVLAKDSAYAFSTVLFTYLAGLAVGSLGVRWFIRIFNVSDIKSLFFKIQFSIGLFAVLAFLLMHFGSQHITLFRFLVDTSFKSMIHPEIGLPADLLGWFRMTDILIYPMFLFFIPTVLMGASFPVIADLTTSDYNKEAKSLGIVYFFNIMGNVMGGLVTGFILLPLIKTMGTVLLFSSINFLFISFATLRFIGRPLTKKISVLTGIIAVVLTFLLLPDSKTFYNNLHQSMNMKGKSELFFEEGRESVVLTYVAGQKMINFINGSSHGFRPGYSYYKVTREAVSHHSGKPENVLIIGCGAGSIVDACIRIPSVERVELVELNGTLMRNLVKIKELNDFLSHEKLKIIIEDGRRYLYRNKKKYDLIFIDPLREETAYSNNIHSFEFLSLLKEHMNENAILFVGAKKSHFVENTMVQVFPYVNLYTTFMIGSSSPMSINEDNLALFSQQFNDDETTGMDNFENPLLMDRSEFVRKYPDYPYNRDWKPVGEYYLGRDYRIKKATNTSE